MKDNIEIYPKYLENRDDFNCTKLNWSTGIIICTKI